MSTLTSEAIVEIDRYVSESLLNRNSDPLKWRNNRRNIYPNLIEMMLLRLCVPSSLFPVNESFQKPDILFQKDEQVIVK